MTYVFNFTKQPKTITVGDDCRVEIDKDGNLITIRKDQDETT